MTSGACARASQACDEALVRAFQILGKRWSGVILGTLANGTLGFAELRRQVIGISDSVLAERLVELHTAGLVERDVRPGPPVSVTYQLSGGGAALVPALHALSAWALGNLPSAQ
ncbi:MAG: putative transcriptional regulator, ArsR family [Acidimicrobiaceae bacterium]|nr:putative transcriptional regulator, ArsR family [Acidimicrobiaceae bacterium]